MTLGAWRSNLAGRFWLQLPTTGHMARVLILAVSEQRVDGPEEPILAQDYE
jgi:hypothetical protein